MHACAMFQLLLKTATEVSHVVGAGAGPQQQAASTDLTMVIPLSKWDVDAFQPDIQGDTFSYATSTRFASVLPMDVAMFDAELFRMGLAEAECMDPHTRQLLELTHVSHIADRPERTSSNAVKPTHFRFALIRVQEALAPVSIGGARADCGVYVGCMWSTGPT